MHQVRAATLIGYIPVASSVGLDPYEMLREARISPSFLENPENRHAADQVVDLLEESAARAQCDSFGLLMAKRRSFPSIGPLSLLLEHVPTVDDVIRALQHYRRLMNDVITLEYALGRDIALLQLISAPGLGKPQILDLTVGMGYRVLTEVSGKRWAPEVIHLTRAPPEDPSIFHRFFSAPVEFNSGFNGFSCSTGSLRAPTLAAEPTLADHARLLLDLLPLPEENAPISDNVRRAIALHLPSGRASLERVSGDMGMNPRTLQRLLAVESTSFGALLNEVRRDLAQNYLESSTQSIETVSALLGYSCASSFSRWFMSEFGKSPSAWRQEAAGPERPEPTEARVIPTTPEEFDHDAFVDLLVHSAINF